jgi:hypothetical protein
MSARDKADLHELTERVCCGRSLSPVELRRLEHLQAVDRKEWEASQDLPRPFMLGGDYPDL